MRVVARHKVLSSKRSAGLRSVLSDDSPSGIPKFFFECRPVTAPVSSSMQCCPYAKVVPFPFLSPSPRPPSPHPSMKAHGLPPAGSSSLRFSEAEGPGASRQFSHEDVVPRFLSRRVWRILGEEMGEGGCCGLGYAQIHGGC